MITETSAARTVVLADSKLAIRADEDGIHDTPYVRLSMPSVEVEAVLASPEAWRAHGHQGHPDYEIQVELSSQTKLDLTLDDARALAKALLEAALVPECWLCGEHHDLVEKSDHVVDGIREPLWVCRDYGPCRERFYARRREDLRTMSRPSNRLARRALWQRPLTA